MSGHLRAVPQAETHKLAGNGFSVDDAIWRLEAMKALHGDSLLSVDVVLTIDGPRAH